MQTSTSVTLQPINMSLWQATVLLDSGSYFAGYWHTEREANTACQIYARILQLQEEED